jgi:Holliday junction resolvasome RuvABC ATP-dependent DNA helicase subunit
VVEEILYPAIEDFELNIVAGQVSGARITKLAVKPFTMVRQTLALKFSAARPLRSALSSGLLHHADLTQIIQPSAHLLGVRIDEDGSIELARRARGTPRIANRLLRRVRDFAQVNEAPVVTREVALGAMQLLEIDACGFDNMDRATGRDNRQVRRRPSRSGNARLGGRGGGRHRRRHVRPLTRTTGCPGVVLLRPGLRLLAPVATAQASVQ